MLNNKLRKFLENKSCQATQIVKYVMSGGVAVAVDQMTFYLLAWLVFPCLRLTDPAARFLEWIGFEVQSVDEVELERNYWIIKYICFVVSNTVVYILNVLFVFHSGRHRKVVEILLFFGSSLFQFFFIWLGGILITRCNWEVTYANIAMLAISMVINYLVRKKIIFNG